jgi:hypothetical protein
MLGDAGIQKERWYKVLRSDKQTEIPEETLPNAARAAARAAKIRPPQKFEIH